MIAVRLATPVGVDLRRLARAGPWEAIVARIGQLCQGGPQLASEAVALGVLAARSTRAAARRSACAAPAASVTAGDASATLAARKADGGARRRRARRTPGSAAWRGREGSATTASRSPGPRPARRTAATIRVSGAIAPTKPRHERTTPRRDGGRPGPPPRRAVPSSHRAATRGEQRGR